MADKIITVKEARLVEKGDNKWVELIDMETPPKTHRVFGSMQDNAGNWLHFEDKFDMLLASEGKALKLTKEKKGKYYNVIGVELVKNAFVQQAQKQVEAEGEDLKNKSVMLSYSKDLVVADKIKAEDILFKAQYLYEWLTGKIQVNWALKEIKTEVHIETKTPETVAETPSSQEVPDDKARQMALDKVQKGQRFTEELRLEINKVGFTKEGVTRFIHEMFGIDPTDKSPGMLINELNDAQFKVFEQEIESRKGE